MATTRQDSLVLVHILTPVGTDVAQIICGLFNSCITKKANV